MKIFMCKPDYFDVIHKDLNIHMQLLRDVNKELAIKQWDNLYTIIKSLDVEIELIDPVKNLVDMVFAANAATIYNNIAIIANFSAIPRIPESTYWSEFLHKKGYTLKYLNNNHEGQGDSLFSHNKTYLWCGSGFRSNNTCVNEISEVLYNVKVISLKMIMPEFYHLDTCFCILDEEYILYYPDAFDESSIQKIHKVFGEKQIIVTKEEALHFICNSINVGKNIIMNKIDDDSVTLINLKELGFNVIQNDMSEYLLSGGSCKCCILHT
jgi:N-dimethylarginine dimethylaminohydrolase